MRNLLLLFCTVFIASLTAQRFEFTPAYPPVSAGGRDLPLAWFGGLNAPQTMQADLDDDGREDLYIFDKAGQLHLALKGMENGTYEEAPELTEFFPAGVMQWVSMRDFDANGVPDLFTYARAVDGIEVYRGTRREDGRVSFEIIDFGDPLPQLYAPAGSARSPIFVSNIDYPAIEDIDGDGDLDILTFAVAGGKVDMFTNLSVERGFGTDTLIYELTEQCWGGFFESGITTALDLAPAPGECFDNLAAPGAPSPPRHAGSTLLALDYTGNGLKDLMLGDISFQFLVLALNNGTPQEAWISAQDSTWDTGETIVRIPSFPAAFHVDVDTDGDKDIVVSPSVVQNGEDTEVMWWYRNDGSDAAPEFNFVQPDYLMEDMLDFGTSTTVAVFDENGDGRPDLVVGNNDQYNGENFLDSRLRLLRNVTPPGGEIAFELVNDDYLGLSAFATTTWAFAPAFGDMDGDGDQDAVIGERMGNLIYLENTAGAGNPAAFAPPVFEWFGIDAGQFSKPFVSDLDRDGKMDLLVGTFDGRIRFYHNLGTPAQPSFDPDNASPDNVGQLGGINTNTPGSSTGHPTPRVIQHPDYTLLLTGNRAGTVEAYRFGADSSFREPFTLLTEQAGSLQAGNFSSPAFGDFDGDGVLEMVLGNQRGGLQFYGTSLRTDGSTGLFSPAVPAFDFRVFPNPTSSRLTISDLPVGVSEVALLDVTGRVLRRESIRAGSRVQWNVNGISAGVYLVRATGAAGIGVRRVVVE